MLARRMDLELAQDAASRFLPAVIAVMVFLAALALGGGLSLGKALANWQQTLEGHLTAEIASTGGRSPTPATVQKALVLLSGASGVTMARVLGPNEVQRLLAPWLGSADLSDLPVPALIEVELEPGAKVDTASLGRRLAAAVPGASLDDDAHWLKPLVRLTEALRLIAGAIVLLVALATVAMVVFATRAGLAVHREVIAVLHLVGAHDLYVARQFEAHVLRLSLTGGIPGLIAALLVMGLLRWLSGGLGAALLPPVTLDGAALLALILVPLIAAALAVATARATVLGTLRRMT